MGVIASLKKRFLIENRGAVFRSSATLRFIEMTLLIVVLDLLAALLPSFADYVPFDSRYMLAAASICGSLAYIARFIPQSSISNPTKKEPQDGADQ